MFSKYVKTARAQNFKIKGWGQKGTEENQNHGREAVHINKTIQGQHTE